MRGATSRLPARQQTQQRPSSAALNSNPGSRSSSSVRTTSKPRSNTPGVMPSSSASAFSTAAAAAAANTSLPPTASSPLYYSSSTPTGYTITNHNSPVPKSTRAAMQDFSKPTAAAMQRNATSSVLVERLRNIVSKHEDRPSAGGGNADKSSALMVNKQQQLSSSSEQQQQQQQQMCRSDVGGNQSNGVVTSSSSRPTTPRAITTCMSATSQHNNNVTVGAEIDIHDPSTWNPPQQQQQMQQPSSMRWRGGQDYGDDNDGGSSDYYSDDDEEDESEVSSTPSHSPKRPSAAATSPSSSAVRQQQQQQQQQRQRGGDTTVVVPGFSWCADWTKRGMRPREVVFNEQNKVAADATHHVEPRNLDMWLSVDKVGSFQCRRCGLPAFPAAALMNLPRAGHVAFTERFSRCSEPDLCPGDGSVIMRCVRCHAFLADIYDKQATRTPPVFRASSWALWHAPEVVVPPAYATTCGPYNVSSGDDDDGDDDGVVNFIDDSEFR